jgi:putative membrane protein
MNILEAAVTGFIDRKLAQPPALATRPDPATRSLAKGILAGVAAGLAAAAAKSFAEKIYPPAPKESLDEPTHWAVGAAAGAAYGALAEFYPAATSRDGINFGLTMMALTHEGNQPASNLAAVATTREKTSEFASHIVFGVVAETTRRFVRKML